VAQVPCSLHLLEEGPSLGMTTGTEAPGGPSNTMMRAFKVSCVDMEACTLTSAGTERAGAQHGVSDLPPAVGTAVEFRPSTVTQTFGARGRRDGLPSPLQTEDGASTASYARRGGSISPPRHQRHPLSQVAPPKVRVGGCPRHGSRKALLKIFASMRELPLRPMNSPHSLR
jgi:hypothetical protein